MKLHGWHNPYVTTLPKEHTRLNLAAILQSSRSKGGKGRKRDQLLKKDQRGIGNNVHIAMAN